MKRLAAVMRNSGSVAGHFLLWILIIIVLFGVFVLSGAVQCLAYVYMNKQCTTRNLCLLAFAALFWQKVYFMSFGFAVLVETRVFIDFATATADILIFHLAIEKSSTYHSGYFTENDS
jgi:hypothetical protein